MASSAPAAAAAAAAGPVPTVPLITMPEGIDKDVTYNSHFFAFNDSLVHRFEDLLKENKHFDINPSDDEKKKDEGLKRKAMYEKLEESVSAILYTAIYRYKFLNNKDLERQLYVGILKNGYMSIIEKNRSNYPILNDVIGGKTILNEEELNSHLYHQRNVSRCLQYI